MGWRRMGGEARKMAGKKGKAGRMRSRGKRGVRYFNGLGHALNASITARVASGKTRPSHADSRAMTAVHSPGSHGWVGLVRRKE